ncbi:CopG family transcriptional regulator [Geoglobus acetivorans]|uniref:CopG family transcriptional regulator n=1 Tax=Geoglobus acetivorans TaxID=565033 RepID=A0ABZ3H1J1_GEOAI|nr:CopG family transcriptional regulator [Geoglobus acetivorans]
MKNPPRISIALDDETYSIFNELKESFSSASEFFRELLKFYREFSFLEDYDPFKIKTYVEMLSEGEHVILDIDHLVAFLRFIKNHPDSDEFWRVHENVSKAHADEFRGKDVNFILKRLETCNFFRLNVKEGEYTLVTGNEEVKEFTKKFLEGVFEGMGLKFEIKEEFAKLRIKTEKN